jgi:hypothetical protein
VANIFLKIGKGIEVAAEDLLGFTQKGNATAQGASPAVLAALGVLASGVEKALTDTAGAAANPILGLVEAPAEIADFKAVWPEVKSFLATLGIKV